LHGCQRLILLFNYLVVYVSNAEANLSVMNIIMLLIDAEYYSHAFKFRRQGLIPVSEIMPSMFVVFYLYEESSIIKAYNREVNNE
jgi:hypothetical protein